MGDIREIVKERVLLLDGAMGTMIQRLNLSEQDFRGERFAHMPGIMKGNNDMLNITRPDVISEIHRLYLEAGSDIIETNTFSSQAISMADYHMEEYCDEMNREGVRIARRLADEYTLLNPEKPRFVAGSVGPTNQTCSLSPDVSNPSYRSLTFDRLKGAYASQIRVLLEEGVDILLFETIFDTLNAKAAVFAAQEVFSVTGMEVPIMLSITVSDTAGRTLSGQTIEAFLASVSDFPIFSVGLNCSFGASMLKPYLEIMAKRAPFYISCHPNAGLPNSFGEYDQTPEMMADDIRPYLDESLVNIIGGCCGTTDEYIRAFAPLVAVARPHIPAPFPENLWLSGIDFFEKTGDMPFVNVGERCNVAGSRKFLRLINEKNYEEALQIARQQVENGALVIDVNMDDGLLNAREEMVTFLNLIASEPEIARVPVMIDSSRWDVIEAGLKCVQGKAIVNSISLKEGEEAFLEKARLIRLYGAAVVVMAFDEEGQASTYERRTEVCARSYRLLTEKAGINPANIIFDPNVLAIATGIEEHDSYALDFIRTCEYIHKNFPLSHISGGVSNLSFSFRGNNYIREAMHAVFLYHAIANGMDFGIVNPSSSVQYQDIEQTLLDELEDVILMRKPGAADRLIETAQRIKQEMDDLKAGGPSIQAAARKKDAWREESVDERLCLSLQKGLGDYLETDLQEALSIYPDALHIIEGPLMEGMMRVGRLFGEGKMFLPQVVKTARTMKKAVDILQPYITSNEQGGKKAGRVIVATVKGDVHDIGKNIAALIMTCNGYDVIDLGVMVPADVIVRNAIEHNVDAVILSGLITPSLEEMVHVARELEKAGFHNPLMVSGATTSDEHTAVKIAPVYGGPVFHLRDASQNSVVLGHLLNDAEHESFVSSINMENKRIRDAFNSSSASTVSFDEANENGLKLF